MKSSLHSAQMDTTTSKEAFLNLIKIIKDPEKRLQEEDGNGEKLIKILETLSDHSITHIHSTLTQLDSSAIEFNLTSCVEELKDSAGSSGDEQLKSLVDLLQSSHLKSLLSCHDMISAQDYGLPKLAHNFHDDQNSFCSDDVIEESMKVVRLIKTDEPLGATISHDASNENIIVARILRGGMADQGGLIHADDIIVEINGEPTKGKTPVEVTKILSQFRGALTLKLIPGEKEKNGDFEPIYIRPRFSFDPTSDDLIPCPKAGLPFTAGDVLCVISKDDEAWWQATKVQCGEEDSNTRNNMNTPTHLSSRAGIIPSIKLQTRREKHRRQVEKRKKLNESVSIKGSNMSLINRERRTAWSSIKASFRRKNHSMTEQRMKARSASNGASANNPPFFPPYQVVSEIAAPSSTGSYRPIVLVGPTGVGRNELKERLIDSDPVLYGVPVPHTSRPKLMNERDGVDYHFVTRDFMEAGVNEKVFLEFGEYKGNLYGTSVDAVKSVARSQQICVLTPGPQALGILRTKELKPYVIFIKPPTMNEYSDDSSTPMLKPKLTLDRAAPNGLTHLELHDLAIRAHQMKRQFGRLFDTSLTFDDPNISLERLKKIIHTIQNHSQFVPIEWTTTES